jgi:hypothetical protein
MGEVRCGGRRRSLLEDEQFADFLVVSPLLVLFRELLAYLRDETTDNARGTSQARKKYARDYIPTRSIYELKEDDRLMNFLEAMCELFSQSHAHMIQDVKKWASRLDVAALTDKQHTELEQLFDLYDADGSGSVSLEELEAHFTNLGFTEDDNARMFKMMDRDSGGEVSGGAEVAEWKAGPFVAGLCDAAEHRGLCSC